MVDAEEFREDLYYRLNVFEIQLPPLRERMDDLESLIESILTRIGRKSLKFSAEAITCLKHYRFPGNIRELRNIVERAAILSDSGTVDVVHLPRDCRKIETGNQPITGKVVSLETAERRFLEQAVELHKGSRRELADKLGISERALYRKLAALKVPE